MLRALEAFSIFIFLGLLISGSLFGQTVRKGPYLIYTGLNTEMQVLWQLDINHTDTIRWGNDQTYSLGLAASGEYGSNHQHTYTITGLTPAMKYYYNVKTGDSNYVGEFRSAPAANGTALKFLAYGDTRSYPAQHDAVAGSVLSAIDSDSGYQSFILSVGDLVTDGNSESYWTNEMFGPAYLNIQTMLTQLPYQAVRGNHEGAAVLFQTYFPYPYVASRYWSFNYGPSHIAVVDQYVAYDSASVQFQWLDNDLRASTQPWKFVCLHEPGWSAYGGHPNNANVQKYIEPLCEKYDVRLVFAGHNHYYARANVPAANGNTIYHVTTGGGGAPFHTPDPTQPYVVATAKAYHYCRINILSSSLLEFKAVSTSGAVIDSFAINKSSSLPVAPVLLSPVNGSITEPTSPNLIWHKSNNAIRYRIQLASDSIFDAIIIDDSTLTDTTRIVGSLTNSNTYYWRVRAVNTGGASQWSSTWNFSTEPPLPIQLASFAATGDNVGHITIQWSTMTEVKNLGFYIERAREELRDYSILSNLIPGNGTSLEEHKYEWIDSSVVIGTYYYRLKQVDLDGSITYSQPIKVIVSGVTEAGSHSELPESYALETNYPNPFNPSTVIRYELPTNSRVTLKIYNILGQGFDVFAEGIQSAGYKSVQWNARLAASGVYYYVLVATSVSDPTRHFSQARKMLLVK